MVEERKHPGALAPLAKRKPLERRPLARTHAATPDPREAQSKTPEVDPYVIQLAACQALDIPHPEDVAKGDVEGLFHYVGRFLIADSEGATTAAIGAFRSSFQRNFFSYAEYQNAVRKIDSLNRKERYELSEIETAFRAWFKLDRYTPNLSGYLSYIGDHVEELSEVLYEPLDVYTPNEPRLTHSYILGTTKSGKTELIKTLIHSYVSQPEHPENGAIVVIEPSGDFVEQVAKWPEFVGSDRLVYLKVDLRPGMVPTINPLEIPDLDPDDTSREALALKQVVAQQLLAALEGIISDRAGGTLTVNMNAVLMSCLLVLLEKPGATLRDLQRFMDDDANDDLVAFGASRTHFPSASALFQGPFKNGGSFKTSKSSIYAKLQTLLGISFFTELTCGKTTVEMETLLDNRSVILFDMGKGSLGPSVGSAFGRFVIAYIQSIVLRRQKIQKKDRVPIHLFVDECHNYLISTIEEIVAESRKFGLFLTLAQQNVGDGMSDRMKKLVSNNTTVKISGKVEPALWEATAGQFPVDKGKISALSKTKKPGRFLIRAGSGAEPFVFQARSDLVDERRRTSWPLWEVTKGEQVRRFYRSVEEQEEREKPSPAAASSQEKKKKKYDLE